MAQQLKVSVVFTGSNHRQVREALGDPVDLNCRGPYLPVGDLGYCQIRADDGEWINVEPGREIFWGGNGHLIYR